MPSSWFQSEVPEVLGVCDRVIVLQNGRQVCELETGWPSAGWSSAGSGDGRRLIWRKVKKLRSRQVMQAGLKYGIYLLFLFIVLILAITCPSFRTIANASNVLLQVTTYAVLGIGMTFVIMTGGIDVSIGGIMVCCGSVYSVLSQSGVSDGIAIAAMFLVALVVGTVNGISVAYLGMPAFLATLATQCMCRGLSLVLTGGASYRNLGASFTFFGKTKLFSVSIQIWAIALLFVIGYLILHKTVYGRKLIAVGGNLNAARVSGINDRLITCSAYIMMGVISGIAGYLNMAASGQLLCSDGRWH